MGSFLAIDRFLWQVLNEGKLYPVLDDNAPDLAYAIVDVLEGCILHCGESLALRVVEALVRTLVPGTLVRWHPSPGAARVDEKR